MIFEKQQDAWRERQPWPAARARDSRAEAPL